jgi:hypothetical protein
MKKNLLTVSGVAIAFGSFAQLPVSTTPQNRKVVLEEFTGIHCQFCPDGHKMANELKAAKPAGSVVIANVHTGGYATPAAGEPDFRTSDGNAIAGIPGMGITGYPTGSINRKKFFGKSAMALNRSEWNKYADSILATPSYVNIALQGTLNVSTRTLTVTVQAYYTGNSPVPTNNLSVMLLEENVYGPQIGAATWYPAMVNSDGTYTHNHLLRDVITPDALGEVISTTTMGTTVNKTYTYQIPAQYVNTEPVLGNLQIVGFMAESASDIVTAAYGPITLTGFEYTSDAKLMSANAEKGVCAGVLNPEVKIYNNGSNAITSASIEYKVNGGTPSTYNYTGTINPATFKTIVLPEISFTPVASNNLSITVTTINGAADQNAANSTTEVTNIPLTTKLATHKTLTMNFTQDRYGSESSWKVFEDGTTTVVAQDGPFPNLSANGTQLNTKNFDIDPSKCYRLEVYDEYGDGINSGAGQGKYELLSGTDVLISSNGTFTSSESNWYKSDVTLGLDDIVAMESVSIYPNPVTDQFSVAFSLVKPDNVEISVFDMMGRLMTKTDAKSMNVGQNQVDISVNGMAAGIYNVKIQTKEGSINRRITVAK